MFISQECSTIASFVRVTETFSSAEYGKRAVTIKITIVMLLQLLQGSQSQTAPEAGLSHHRCTESTPLSPGEAGGLSSY